MSDFLCTIFLTASSFSETAPLPGKAAMSIPAGMRGLVSAGPIHSAQRTNGSTAVCSVPASTASVQETSFSNTTWLHVTTASTQCQILTSFVCWWCNDAIWAPVNLLLRPRVGAPILPHGNRFGTPKAASSCREAPQCSTHAIQMTHARRSIAGTRKSLPASTYLDHRSRECQSHFLNNQMSELAYTHTVRRREATFARVQSNRSRPSPW